MVWDLFLLDTYMSRDNNFCKRKKRSCSHENEGINGSVLIQLYIKVFHSTSKIKERKSYEDLLKGLQNTQKNLD